jgi:hypothetical protein
MEYLPKLIGDMAGAKEPLEPVSETIDGVKVFSLPGDGLRWNAPVHYARAGSEVAFGLDRNLVAQAATANPAASVAGGGSVVAPPGDTAALGVVSLGGVFLRLTEKPKPADGMAEPVEMRVLPNGNPLPDNFVEDLKKAEKAFCEVAANMQPAILTARRVGNELRFELFQPKAQTGGLKGIIDAGVDWLDKAGPILGSEQGNQRFGRLRRGLW